MNWKAMLPILVDVACIDLLRELLSAEFIESVEKLGLNLVRSLLLSDGSTCDSMSSSLLMS